MSLKTRVALLSVAVVLPLGAGATGIHQCEATTKSDWLSKAEMEAQLEAVGWIVRFMNEDGGCWEVYGTNPAGQRVEGYFYPVTGEAELIPQRGRILFSATKESN